jgi:ABC-type glycerol-3-phosphate transport system permease component
MFVNSVKTRPEYFTNPFGLPQEGMRFTNFETMVSQMHLFKLFFNSFVISIFTVILMLAIGVFASYVFARMEFKGKNLIYLAVIMTMFIPIQVTIIPLYGLFADLGLVDEYWSVVFSYVSIWIPEAILLMTATFRGILNELFESAEIDGCNYFQKIWYVTIPMGRAAIFLTIIFYFIMSWNDLFTPLIFLQSMDKQTVMVALAGLMGRYQGSPTLQFAGLLLGAVPALIIYILFQKQIIGGLTVGALK